MTHDSFWNNFKEKFIHQFLFESGAKTKNEAIKLFNWLKGEIPVATDYIKEDTTRYVLGFLFSEDFKQVVLIKKNKPEWQKGYLNGIGGKVEITDQSFKHSMSREFKEETGMDIDPEKWVYFSELLEFNGLFYVSCYAAVGDVSQVKTMEDEEVGVYYVDTLNAYPVINNLKWLIPMALYDNITCTAYYNIKT